MTSRAVYHGPGTNSYEGQKAWFSPAQARAGAIVSIYKMKDGSKQEVTYISSQRPEFGDAVLVGEPAEFIKTKRLRGPLDPTKRVPKHT